MQALGAVLSQHIRQTICLVPSNASSRFLLSIRATLAPIVRDTYRKKAGLVMFLILAVVLIVLWLGGFVMFKSAGLLIHLLLLFAVISLIMHFVSGRSTV
jgi:hypothetical protein